MSDAFEKIIADVAAERERQVLKWGKQEHPNGTSARFRPLADAARNNCQAAISNGNNTWMHVMRKQVWDTLSETDRVNLRKEVIQLIAVGVAWVVDLDEKA